MRRILCVATLFAAFLAGSASAEAWRLDRALGLPERVTLSIDHRIRYEALDDQFRVGRAGGDDVLMLRTRVHGRVRLGGGVTVGAEVQDSRAHLDDPTTPLNTGSVNAVELLQAYAELDHEILGGEGLLRVGRITLDVGSRRFVARNRFRNTSNGFTGIDWSWKSDGGATARMFYTLPLRRRPFRADSLRDDDIQLDEESFDLQFWGLHGSTALPWGPGRDRLELFVFGLHEEKSASGTRNRDLYTPGLRLRRSPKRGEFDYEFESALQAGQSRVATVGADLDHFAHFLHLELGYSFACAGSPRLALQYDHASGDKGSTDGDNERFDTLFGARRFDFGPTSIYGPFARANLSTPGVRLQLKPHPGVSSFVAVSGFWLASDRDAWTMAGARDVTGDSRKYLGTQIEWRLRWDLRPGNVRFETGLAHLFDGGFVRDAPNSNRQGDSSYAYAQLIFQI
jgi:hypothetical protein